MKFKGMTAVAALVFVTTMAAPARADVTLTPFIGGLFGGILPSGAKPAYGVSLTAMGAGIIGAEFDFSWTPGFVEATSFNDSVTEANMTGNLIVGVPIGGTHGSSV